jgi:SAM-dependent methyltransferase
MGRFHARARGHEYMDEPDIAGQVLHDALRELEVINRHLGGHRTSILSIELLLRAVPANRELTVLDVGAGGADTTIELERWSRGVGRSLRVVSMDINPFTCARARDLLTRDAPRVPAVVAADVFHMPFRPASFDIVHSSLFLHHFDDEEAAVILRTLRGLARIGVIVNDLHRHALAYWSVRLGSALFSASEFVRHDGPLSVLRGFRRHELETLAHAAGASPLSLKWRWGFRWALCLPSGST